MPKKTKVITMEFSAEEDYQGNGHDLAHEMLEAFNNDKYKDPRTLICAASHFLAHILLAAPSEEVIKAGMKLFLLDLDYNHLVDIHKERMTGKQAPAEETPKTVH